MIQTETVSKMYIMTDCDPVDIAEAIDVVTQNVIRFADESNQFAASMMNIDLDAAEVAMNETERQLAATRLLLRFAQEIVENERFDEEE
jgi:hypothetical protein